MTCYRRGMALLARLLLFLGCVICVYGKETNATKKIHVAIFEDKGVAGKGVPRSMQFLTNAPNIQVAKLNGSAVASGALTNFDVIIFSGGSGSQQAASLGDKGREEVRNFVKQGGGYIGICAGAYLACSGFDWGLGIINGKTVSSKWQRGKGTVRIETVPERNAAIGLTPGKHDVLYANGPIIRSAERRDLPQLETLAYFRSELVKNGTPEGIMINSPAIAQSTFGKGRVLFCSPHPEQTDGMEKFIESAVRSVCRRDD